MLQVVITLILIGVLLWAVNTYVPMAASIKNIINIVAASIKNIINIVVVLLVVFWLLSVFVVLLVVFWLLSVFGVFAYLGAGPGIPRLHHR